MKLSMLVYVRKYTCLASAKYQKENIRHMAKLIKKYGTLTPFGENCFTNKAFSLIKSFFLFWVFQTSNINPTPMRGIVATSRDGIVSLSGLDQSESVSFYTPDGTQISTVKAIGGVASQAVSSYSVVIAKIGRLTIKIAVK